MIRLVNTPISPMESEMRAPYTTRENRSRPMRSAPRRNRPCSSWDTGRPNRWRLEGIKPHNLYSVPREKNSIE